MVGRADEAVDMLGHLVMTNLRIYGRDHPQTDGAYRQMLTVNCFNNLGYFPQQQSQSDSSEGTS